MGATTTKKEGAWSLLKKALSKGYPKPEDFKELTPEQKRRALNSMKRFPGDR